MKQIQAKTESKILSHSVIFSITMYPCLLLGLLRGLIVAKLLGPAVYGIRNVFGVIMDFNIFLKKGWPNIYVILSLYPNKSFSYA